MRLVQTKNGVFHTSTALVSGKVLHGQNKIRFHSDIGTPSGNFMPVAATVCITDEGLSYRWPLQGTVKSTGFIKWSEIDSIDAFKRDIFSYDLICIHLVGPKSPSSDPIEIDEKDQNWKALLAAFSKRLPQFKPYSEWFPFVAYPAFATNLLRIYDRPD